MLALFFALSAFAAAPTLPAGLGDFLGPPPPRFEQKFRKPARELKTAQAFLAKNQRDAAIKKLVPLVNGELGEHASFELAGLYRAKKEFAKSNAQAERVLRAYPGSVYQERLRDLLDDNECDQGLVAKGEEAAHLLERCLWRKPWKGWSELEPQATALYLNLKAAKDPLLEPFVAEFLQAMPAGSALRQRLAREIPNDQLEELATLARYRTRSTNAPGVKALNPDVEQFDAAMKLVLQQNWGDANKAFRQFLAQFPTSEHAERAQFWIARTEDKLGHSDEAKKLFQQILEDNPFTYYGMQAAVYLQHDWGPRLADPTPLAAAKWEGAVVSRQALSLWRLRALMEYGLVDYAREEARFLAQAKSGGAGIGQEDPQGALMLATLFHRAGYHLAAFSQAYAALSLDQNLLNRASASLIFPDVYADEFQAAAEASGVHPLLLASVAKQESAFLPNALSRADALGLLQLLPVTAREVVPKITREQLFEPKANARAGALYLQKLLARFSGNIALALAAYNAGPNRASQWQKDLAESPLFRQGFDVDAFIDTIPFTETRKYVGNILRNYAWYKLLQNGVKMGSVQELNSQWQNAAPKEEASETTPAAT